MTLVFRKHAVERMFERAISIEDVKHTLASGKICEHYARDYPYPSALWLGFVNEVPLHVAVADNASAAERIVATVYRPNAAQWYLNWTTRRQT